MFEPLPAGVEETLYGLESGGKSAVIVGSEWEVFGVIALADALRPVTPGVVQELDALDVRTVMLTGDHEIAARRVAAAAGVDDVRAGLLPDQKVDAIAALEAEQPVAMVGDGINDAPALARASVGIAMGASGTDAAIEAADVALLSDDLSQLPGAIRLARKTLAIIRENIAASIVVKFAVLALTLFGVTSLWLAVLADVGMSLAVTLNSLRLARTPSPQPSPVRERESSLVPVLPSPVRERGRG
jgi:Cd2+/Zn2+-exporting ATPase